VQLIFNIFSLVRLRKPENPCYSCSRSNELARQVSRLKI
jgi:hypothetical protein